MTKEIDKLQVITLTNKNGLELKVSNYGATIISLEVPDKNNDIINVIVGLADASNYLEEPYSKTGLYLGASIGRYAGRISQGKFYVDDNEYCIHHTDGVHLHGGKYGFDQKYWDVDDITAGSVTLSYTSKHLEEGYPGNLKTCAIYQLTDDNILKITYKANTDIATPVNLTNHAYFNLKGKGSILNDSLKIISKKHLEVTDQLIPTGKIKDSKNTKFDYALEKKIDSDFKGLDDTFVLDKEDIKATLTCEESGIKMNVRSNQPAMVVYTPKQFPDLPFKNGVNYTEFSAICFETQNYPDAPNNPHFPNSILRLNEKYRNESSFEFLLIKPK